MANNEDASIKNSAITGAVSQTVNIYGSAVKEHYVSYGGIDNETGKILTRSLKDIAKSKVNPNFKDQNIKQQAGFSAENKYTARQNAENIINGKTNRTIRTDDLGRVNDPLFDHVEIDSKGNIIADSGLQMKFVGSDAKSALSKLESKEYQKYIDANAKLSVPSDFYNGIKEEAQKKIQNLTEQLKRAQKDGNSQLAKTLKSRITKLEKINKNLKDSGITNKEAIEARLNPELSVAKDVLGLAHKAGLQGAKFGAGIGGSVSLIKNVVALVRGEKTATDAATSLVKDTTISAGIGYGTAAIGTALKGAMQNSTSQTMRSLSKTNVAAGIVTGVFEVSKTMTSFVRGDIDGVQCLEQLGEKGTAQIASIMFATAGQIAIPIPVVGAAIGSTIGYALSSACYAELMNSLKEAKLARERRIQIERKCEEISAMMKEFKREMDEYFSNKLKIQLDIFNEVNDEIAVALKNNDINGFINANNTIQESLGYKTQFSSFAEFDKFMSK